MKSSASVRRRLHPALQKEKLLFLDDPPERLKLDSDSGVVKISTYDALSTSPEMATANMVFMLKGIKEGTK